MNFEAEIWPDSKKMMKVNISLGLVCLLAIVGIIVANIFWDDYMHTVETLRGTRYRGWPSTVQSWSIGFLVLTPLTWAMMFFGQDRKKPMLAANQEGLFINQQLVKATMVPWNEISKFEVNGESVDVTFADATKVINAQGFPYKAFVKSNVTQAGNKMSFEAEGNPEAFQKILALGQAAVG